MNDINTQSMLRVGTLIHGGVYRIEGYLASGGFGNTYVVHNVEFDEMYALKEFYIKGVCQRDSDSTSISVSNAENTECFTQQREKFKKEARRIRSLNNDHIVKMHDLFEENGTAYYVMDLVDGESLASRLKRTGKPLAEMEVDALLPQVVDGLRAIHDMGMWHLDIKPANIMLDKKGVVKLIDFGASKQQSNAGGATMSTGISYTNGYAPAEQMAQTYEDFGPWTDFYALGATLYKLLTMQNPPSVTKVAEDETADKHIALPMHGISDKMKSMIVWMMQDKRKRRPQCAEEILDMLTSATTSDDDATVMIEPKHDVSETLTNTTGAKINYGEEESANVKNPKQNSSGHGKRLGRAAVCAVLTTVVLMFILTKSGKLGGNYVTYTVNGVSFDMAKVEGGTFTMGATPEMGEPDNDEKPAHQVALTNDYYIGKTEVTQALWKAVMGDNPSHFIGDNKPVEQVSWNDCQEFISKLNAATGKNFRLPTEAEREFAARGGNKSKHYQYSGSDNIDDVAWYGGNSGDKTHAVASKRPNELGIYDMSGNVSEWCSDWYGDYSGSAQTNPTGAKSGSYRVYRGGSWFGNAGGCRSSYRYCDSPGIRYYFLGLRLALSE